MKWYNFIIILLLVGISGSLYAAQQQDEPNKRQKLEAAELVGGGIEEVQGAQGVTIPLMVAEQKKEKAAEKKEIPQLASLRRDDRSIEAEGCLEFEFERKSRIGREKIAATTSLPQDLVGLVNDYYDMPQSPIIQHLKMLPKALQNLIAQYAVNPAYYIPAVCRNTILQIDLWEADRISCNKNGLIAAAGKVFDAKLETIARLIALDAEGHYSKSPSLIALRDDDTTVVVQVQGLAAEEKEKTGYVTAKIHARDGALLKELKSHEYFISSIDIGPDGAIITGSLDKTACLWDAQGNLLYRHGVSDDVTAVALGEDGLMVIGQYNGALVVVSKRTGRYQEQILKVYKAPITSVVVQDDQTIITVSDDGVFAWKFDGSRWNCVALKQADEKITASFVSKNGVILTCCDANKLRIWNNDGDLKKVIQIKPIFTTHEEFITCIDMNDDGVIAAGGFDGFRIINADFATQVTYPLAEQALIPRVAIHDNGTMIWSTLDHEQCEEQFGLRGLQIGENALKVLCELSAAQLHKLLFVLDELNGQRVADLDKHCDEMVSSNRNGNRFDDVTMTRILTSEQKEFLTTLPSILQENIYQYYRCSPYAEEKSELKDSSASESSSSSSSSSSSTSKKRKDC